MRPLGYRTDTIGDIEEFTQDDALPLPFFLNADYDMDKLGTAQIPTILLQGALLCCVGSIESLMTAQVHARCTRSAHALNMPWVCQDLCLAAHMRWTPVHMLMAAQVASDLTSTTHTQP